MRFTRPSGSHHPDDEAAYAWATRAYDGPDDRPDRVELEHEKLHQQGRFCGDQGCDWS